jgi:hypothetical protein
MQGAVQRTEVNTEVLSPAFYLQPYISTLNLIVTLHESTDSLILLCTFILKGSNR